MYKCLECGMEYNIKPDYCDCGNDTFIETNKEEEFNKTSSTVQNSILKENMPSIIFLIVCIILSFAILFFIGNPKEQIKKETKKQEKVNNIPNIDDIWNDEKPKQIAYKTPQTPKEINKESGIIQKVQESKIKKEEQKPIIKKQPQIISVPKQNKQTVVQNQTIQKPPVISPVNIKTQTPQIPKPPQQTVQKTTPQMLNTAQSNIQITNPEELKQYKKALRSKIASNIDFLNIAGDGKCVLSFNISQGGNLLNRKFISQSSNTSLNDAVYQGMLEVSSFKTPPSGYKNETLKLTVQITGGNFTVSLE